MEEFLHRSIKCYLQLATGYWLTGTKTFIFKPAFVPQNSLITMRCQPVANSQLPAACPMSITTLKNTSK